MKTIYTYFLIGIGVLLLASSCEKEIDVTLHPVEPKIVIEGLLKLDSLAIVNVTTTKDFNTDNDFVPIFGATVTITDSDGNSEVLNQNRNGLYVARKMKGKYGKTYELNVVVNDEEYRSVSTMPRYVPIEEIKMYYIPSFGYAVPMVAFQDPKGEDNYYRAMLFVNGKRMDIGNETIDTDNRDGVLIERILPVFDDDKDDRRKIERGDIILVELQSLDEGAFTFLETLGRIGMSLNNPTSNIEGGALGYFSTYASDRKEIIADW